METSNESIEAIVADIRNKLTPFYNLAAMVYNRVRMEEPTPIHIRRLLKDQASTAIQMSDIIRKQLEKLTQYTQQKEQK